MYKLYILGIFIHYVLNLATSVDRKENRSLGMQENRLSNRAIEKRKRMMTTRENNHALVSPMC